MDGQQFDQYVQALGRAVNRRGVLAGLGGFLAAGISEVAAKNKHKNKHRRRKGDKAHQQKGGGKFSSCAQLHKTGWCHCQPQKKCIVLCVDKNSTNLLQPPNGHDGHLDDYVCDPLSDCFDAAEGASCPRPVCPRSEPPFSQDFNKNQDTSGWVGVTWTADGGRNGTGGALVGESQGHDCPNGPLGCNGPSYTYWGGKTSAFPAGGYTTQVDIYLDVSVAEGTWFEYTSAISQQNCQHLRDFVFTVGRKSGTDFCVTISNNAQDDALGNDPCTTNPKATLTTSGWYTFKHVFRNDGGVLAVDFILIYPNGTAVTLGTLSNAGDLIATVVGGQQYGWFPVSHWPNLTIDNTARI